MPATAGSGSLQTDTYVDAFNDNDISKFREAFDEDA
jgi:hypothetical protein